jgi:hypothetical protein
MTLRKEWPSARTGQKETRHSGCYLNGGKRGFPIGKFGFPGLFFYFTPGDSQNYQTDDGIA